MKRSDEERAAHRAGARRRPVDDLVFAPAPGRLSKLVLVGFSGDGYVRLNRDQARDRALTLLELAGVAPETVEVIRALL